VRKKKRREGLWASDPLPDAWRKKKANLNLKPTHPRQSHSLLATNSGKELGAIENQKRESEELLLPIEKTDPVFSGGRKKKGPHIR